MLPVVGVPLRELIRKCPHTGVAGKCHDGERPVSEPGREGTACCASIASQRVPPGSRQIITSARLIVCPDRRCVVRAYHSFCVDVWGLSVGRVFPLASEVPRQERDDGRVGGQLVL